MVELFAFALPLRAPLFGNVRGEHTYVVSSQGHRWPCLGRAQGGRPICRGSGDAAVADCVARGDCSAGIRYLRTGVCHQVANRILWPAGLLVERAEGYSFLHCCSAIMGSVRGRSVTSAVNSSASSNCRPNGARPTCRTHRNRRASGHQD